MDKITSYSQLRKIDDWNTARVIFKQENFNKPYSKEERTYEIDKEMSKYFDPEMIGSSIFGNCLDGRDLYVRLDIYDNWKIDEIVIVD